jgi:anaerobic ribonucleoside-triphosphate reductase activating protein
MNIVTTQFTLSTKSLELFISGCKPPHCDNCCNPELWTFGKENNYLEKFTEIKTKIEEFDNLIDNILLVGGCPLDQNHLELTDLLKKLNTLKKTVFLFTRYGLGEVPYYVRRLCGYIKCGRYIPSLKTDDNIQYGIALATSNQNIYKHGKEY